MTIDESLDNVGDFLNDWKTEENEWAEYEEPNKMLQQGGSNRPGKLNDEIADETTLAEFLELSACKDRPSRLERSEIQTRRPGRSEIQTRRPGRSQIQTIRPGRSEIQTRRPGRSEIQTRRPGRSIISSKLLHL